MLVLGLDPGLATTGYGLVDGDGQRLEMVACGAIITAPGQPIAQRLVDLFRQLNVILDSYHPDVAAVEELFFCTNARTAIMVGEGRGVALLALAEAGLDVAEYTPLQIKQATTGYGKAGKAQVHEMVRLLLNLSDIPRPDDAADALAVGICHLHSSRLNDLIRESGG